MMKRLAPLICVLLAMLLDTAVLPIFMYGRYLVPVSLAVVMAIGITLGRMRGMLYGMISGLLLDISAGTLGMKLFSFIIIGFLIGFLLDQQPEISRTMERRERTQLLAVRAIWAAVLVVLFEIVMLVYQYFSTAILKWSYIRDLLVRTLITTALVMLLTPLMKRLSSGKAVRIGKKRTTQEVKKF